MARRLIDLSMRVHNDMVTFPRVVRPSMAMYETWEQFATNIGAAKHGVTWLTASYMVVTGDHIGTHVDSLRHLRDDAPGPEGIPLEYCYGDGVCLDFRHLEKGAGITVNDVKAALTKIKYTIKPLDIVLIHTGAGAIQETQAYLTDHVGMTGEATNWLLDQGVKLAGIDAVTFDPPVWAMFERKQFWEAHRVMLEREYLPSREHDQLRPASAARIHAVGVSGQVGQYDGRSRAGGRDHRGLRSSRSARASRSFPSKGCQPRRPRSPAARAQASPAWLVRGCRSRADSSCARRCSRRSWISTAAAISSAS